jgi:plasmid stabilization system protein ParE
MTFQITWTDNAQEDLQQILDYLAENWSEKDADNFLKKLFLRIDILSKSSLIGKKSDKLSSVRRIVITKHNSLFYTVEGDNIIIQDIFDTRQDPAKSPF